jgi:RNA polymerase sigma factor (sigma-70 family)
LIDDVVLVTAAQAGDRDAFAPLVDRWFDRCWEVAWRILHDRDLAADVAQDTLLIAWRRIGELARPASFGGWVLRIARNRALDRLQRERRMRPTADDDHLEPAVRDDDPAGPEATVIRGQQHDLVWAAAAALGERDASLLDLHLRHGLEPAELADELGITPNAAHQAMFRLRQRLGTAIQAWLLWRDADPACVVLRAELAAAGSGFGADTVRLVRRHTKTCEMCAQEQERVVAPAALFSVVPLLAAPAAARARAMAFLADGGVPVPAAAGAAASRGGGHGHDGGGGPVDGSAEPGGHAGADGVATVGDPSASAMALPAVRGGPGSHSAVRRAGLLLVVPAMVLAIALFSGGLAWSRGRVAPVPDAPVVAPAASPTPVRAAEPSSAAQAQPEPGSGTTQETSETTRRQAPRPQAPRPRPTPTEPAVPLPTIDRMVVRWVGWCGRTVPQREDASEAPAPVSSRYTVVWSATGADSAQLSDAAGVTVDVPPTGKAERCADPGEEFTVTAINAGGSTSVTAQAPMPDAPN